MKCLIRKGFLVAIMAGCTAIIATAYDFASGGLFYNVISGTKTVAVTSEAAEHSSYSGRVIVPESVTYNGEKYIVAAIGNKAFVRSKVTDVQIPDNVTSIGDSAFYFSEELENITLPQKLTKISRCAFAGTSITAIAVPEGVTELGNGAFQSCLRLHTVFLPSTLKLISAYGFNNCSSLSEIYSKASNPPDATGWAIFIGLSKIDLIVPSIDKYENVSPWNNSETFSIYPPEPVEVNINITGKNIGEYDELTLGGNIEYKIYQGEELVAITAADRYYLPSNGKTYSIVPSNTFGDADAVTYTTSIAGTEGILTDNDEDVKIYADGNVIRVEPQDGSAYTRQIYVYDAYGSLYYRSSVSGTEIANLPTGRIYVARCGNVVKKVALTIEMQYAETCKYKFTR